MLKIALLGCGWHSINHHAPALARFAEEHPNTISVMACDVDENRAKACSEICRFSGYTTSPSSLLDERFHAAVVVLPVPLLKDTAQAWLARGIPILPKSRWGSSYEEACQIARLPGAPGQVTVSLNRRFDPGLNRAMEWAAVLSPARFIHGSMLRVNRTEDDFLWSTSIHLLDAMCYAAGPLRSTPGSAQIIDSPGGCGRVSLLEGADGLRRSVEILPPAGRSRSASNCQAPDGTRESGREPAILGVSKPTRQASWCWGRVRRRTIRSSSETEPIAKPACSSKPFSRNNPPPVPGRRMRLRERLWRNSCRK